VTLEIYYVEISNSECHLCQPTTTKISGRIHLFL